MKTFTVTLIGNEEYNTLLSCLQMRVGYWEDRLFDSSLSPSTHEAARESLNVYNKLIASVEEAIIEEMPKS